jgi:uncharacterized protein (UPF0264 family)
MMNLLVSVRSAAEAAAALAGGAGLIDVKEPARGALGRADAAVIAAVVRAVGGRRPVSAALGELAGTPRSHAPRGNAGPDAPRPEPGAGPERLSQVLTRRRASGRAFPRGAWERGLRVPFFSGLSYAKWGLSDCDDWRGRLLRAAAELRGGCRPVAVAYADWRRAGSPAPAEVCAFACERYFGAFLLDTCGKDGSTLLDWCSLPELIEMRECGRRAGVPVALAGSLGVEQIRALRPLGPDWFAVRGAACRGGLRTAPIDAGRVRRLVDLLHQPLTAATPAG